MAKIPKIQLNVRVEPFILEILNDLSEQTGVTKTDIVLTAIKRFAKDNRDGLKSEELKNQVTYLEQEQARFNTRMEMRKAMFKGNVKRRLKIMLRDGLDGEQFNALLKVWSKEAEVNGIERIAFYEFVQGELTKLTQENEIKI